MSQKKNKSKRSRPGRNVATTAVSRLIAAFNALNADFEKLKGLNNKLSGGIGDCLDELNDRVARIEEHLGLGDMDEQPTDEEGSQEAEPATDEEGSQKAEGGEGSNAGDQDKAAEDEHGDIQGTG